MDKFQISTGRYSHQYWKQVIFQPPLVNDSTPRRSSKKYQVHEYQIVFHMRGLLLLQFISIDMIIQVGYKIIIHNNCMGMIPCLYLNIIDHQFMNID